MKLLKIIKDKNYKNDTSLRIREASRAIVFDENKLIPLLFVSKYDYYKLPGGGIEKDEDKIQALFRECLEEIGSKIEVKGEVGKIIEFCSKRSLKQTSYCYFGNVIYKGKPNFTEKELSQGFEIIWISLKDAILKVENAKPKNHTGLFIQKRDLKFLKQLSNLENY